MDGFGVQSSGARFDLVGREDELARLVTRLEDLTVAVILGLPGVGKTALASATAAAWGRPVLRGEVGADAAEAVARIERSGALMLVEDAHDLERTDLEHALIEIGRRLRRGRLLFTSRELLQVDEGPERFELRLGALGEEAARALWTRLDALHGAADGFPAAYRRAHGNPAALRRAHRGILDVEPARALLAALAPNERMLAAVLSLAPAGLPCDLLIAIDPEAPAALRTLVTRLLVEIDGARVAQLCRDAADPGATQFSSAELERARAALPAELLDRWLARGADELLSGGCAAVIIDLTDRIPRAQRSPEVAVARARSLARRLRIVEADEELATISEPGEEVSIDRAVVALRRGRPEEAETHARRALGAEGPAASRARRELDRILAHRGTSSASLDGDDGDDDLLACDPHGQALARARMARARIEQGFRAGAAEELAGAAAELDRGGDILGARLAEVWQARALYLLGRIEAADALLAGVIDDAAARGLGAIEALAAGQRALDPRRQLAGETPANVDDSLASAVAALAAALAGRVLEARPLADRAIRSEGDHGLERMIGHLADAALARFARRRDGHEPALTLAAREAAEHGIDARLYADLATLVQGRLVVSNHGVCITSDATPASAATGAEVVLDARRHGLDAGPRRICFQRRPIVRLLLYALAARADVAVSREELAQAMWGRSYSARIHDNPLKVNVAHLKKLLEGTGLTIVAENRGYRLRVPPLFVFISD